ncbi:MAG: YraN family protein [Gammaproteobacteria bacterium]|nr:YraN family protein [Gammaproteobacteria bacterium]
MPSLDGPSAENLALEHLRDAGLSLLARNHRCRGGELDLVMADGGVVVFVEVRYRRDTRFGRAEETVTVTKQRRLITAARHYLQRRGESAPARFDVVAIHPAADGGHEVEWIRDAFGT